jgi:hypothetical protein
MTTPKSIDQERFESFESYDEATDDYAVVECGEPGCTKRAEWCLMVYGPDGGISNGHAALLCNECLLSYSVNHLGSFR